MELHERELPEMDLKNFIEQCRDKDDNEALIDMMHRGIEILAEMNSGFLVVIYKKEDEEKSIGTLVTLQDAILKGIKIVMVEIGEPYGPDLDMFIRNNEGDIFSITRDFGFSDFLDKIRDILELSEIF